MGQPAMQAVCPLSGSVLAAQLVQTVAGLGPPGLAVLPVQARHFLDLVSQPVPAAHAGGMV